MKNKGVLLFLVFIAFGGMSASVTLYLISKEILNTVRGVSQMSVENSRLISENAETISKNTEAIEKIVVYLDTLEKR